MKKLILLAFILSAGVAHAKTEDCAKRSPVSLGANTNPSTAKGKVATPPSQVRGQK